MKPLSQHLNRKVHGLNRNGDGLQLLSVPYFATTKEKLMLIYQSILKHSEMLSAYSLRTLQKQLALTSLGNLIKIQVKELKHVPEINEKLLSTVEFEVLSVPITAVSNHFKFNHTVVRCLKVLRWKRQAWQAWIPAPVPTAASLPGQPTSLSGCPALWSHSTHTSESVPLQGLAPHQAALQ